MTNAACWLYVNNIKGIWLHTLARPFPLCNIVHVKSYSNGIACTGYTDETSDTLMGACKENSFGDWLSGLRSQEVVIHRQQWQLTSS